MADKEKLKKFIAKATDANKLDSLMENAKKQNENEIYQDAFRRKCELEGRNFNDPLEQRFWEVLAAYEQCLAEKNNKKTPASRVRPKIKREGFKKCLIDWAQNKKPSDGFKLLVENNLYDMTGEFIVLEHEDQFEPKVVKAAWKRFEDTDLVDEVKARLKNS